MIRLLKLKGGEYDVLARDSHLASIRRTSPGASRWRVRTKTGVMFGGRCFNSLTVALDATIAHFGFLDDARALVDQMMIASGRAAPRRKIDQPLQLAEDYYAQFKALGHSGDGYGLGEDAYDILADFYALKDSRESRYSMIGRFAFAIPTDEALGAIVQLGQPLLEVGAGSGYWAFRLARMGARIVATDNRSWKTFKRDWWPVLNMEATKAVLTYPHHTLLISWPPMDTMAVDALSVYTGDTLIFIGEDSGGCTADENFWSQIETGWTEEKMVRLPQWPGMHDNLVFFRRR